MAAEPEPRAVLHGGRRAGGRWQPAVGTLRLWADVRGRKVSWGADVGGLRTPYLTTHRRALRMARRQARRMARRTWR